MIVLVTVYNSEQPITELIIDFIGINKLTKKVKKKITKKVAEIECLDYYEIKKRVLIKEYHIQSILL